MVLAQFEMVHDLEIKFRIRMFAFGDLQIGFIIFANRCVGVSHVGDQFLDREDFCVEAIVFFLSDAFLFA